MTPDFRAGLLKAAEHFDDGPDTIIYRSEVAAALRALAATVKDEPYQPDGSDAPIKDGPNATNEWQTRTIFPASNAGPTVTNAAPQAPSMAPSVDSVGPAVAASSAVEEVNTWGNLPLDESSQGVYSTLGGWGELALRHAKELDRLRAQLSDHRTMHGDTVGQLQHKLSAAEGLLRWIKDYYLHDDATILHDIKRFLNDH
jgi:hypothetical protein